MELPILTLAVVLLGAALGRWSRLHPLLIGAVIGFPVGVLGLLVAGSAMSQAAFGIGLISWLVAAVVGSLGAFAGWLRRKHIERIRQ